MRPHTLFSVTAGMCLGLALFNVQYAKGTAYLQDDPAWCANCHVMGDVYAAWRRSTHHSVAVCNDCHTPAGFLPKYASKALNGFLHSWAFTLRTFPENLRITPRNRKVTEDACLKCHDGITENLRASHPGSREVSCLHCHSRAGHPH